MKIGKRWIQALLWKLVVVRFAIYCLWAWSMWIMCWHMLRIIAYDAITCYHLWSIRLTWWHASSMEEHYLDSIKKDWIWSCWCKCILSSYFVVSHDISWYLISCPLMKLESLANDCFPEPPTPTSRALPQALAVMRQIPRTWYTWLYHGKAE